MVPQSTLSYTSTIFSSLENLTRYKNSLERLCHIRYKLTARVTQTGSLVHHLSGTHTNKTTYLSMCDSKNLPSTTQNALITVTVTWTPLTPPIVSVSQLIYFLSQAYPHNTRLYVTKAIKSYLEASTGSICARTQISIQPWNFYQPTTTILIQTTPKRHYMTSGITIQLQTLAPTYTT